MVSLADVMLALQEIKEQLGRIENGRKGNYIKTGLPRGPRFVAPEGKVLLSRYLVANGFADDQLPTSLMKLGICNTLTRLYPDTKGGPGNPYIMDKDEADRLVIQLRNKGVSYHSQASIP